MITTEWKTDTDKGLDYLECKKESSYGLREPETDIVKVYFIHDFDAAFVKSAKLEPLIANEIFRNRKIFASEFGAWIELTKYGIYFHTSTTIFLSKDNLQSEFRKFRETKGEEK